MKRILTSEEYTARKNRRKIAKVAVQLTLLIVFAVLVVRSLMTFTSYQPYNEKTTKFDGDRGFVALSYFGADRTGTQSIISEERLRDHLAAMKQAGYVTITQQDILDYYHKGKVLPARSLFLIFEDGRRDTAIFAQKSLEELNFQGNVMTYAEKFEERDPKFLLPEELLTLKKTTYWDIGTNGYRLAFINVFDRYANYLGELTQLEHSMVAPYLGRKYNHFLMDYIRDEYGLPKESYNRMKARVSYDYELIDEIYTKGIGHLPAMHVLMHANTGSFGNNDKVSAINDYWIRKMFKLNFNREGFSLNEKKSSLYDLTRMQPQGYWYPNHLIMRVKDDIKEDLPFVTGDLNKHDLWQIAAGALEVRGETLVLTSVPEGRGFLRLKNTGRGGDMRLSARLTGNKMGQQKIYLREDGKLGRYLALSLKDNFFYVEEKTESGERQLFKLDLNAHDGKQAISINEDRQEAEARELEAFTRYADSAAKAEIYARRLAAKKQENTAGVDDGARPYMPPLSVHAQGDRLLEAEIRDNKLTISIDGKPVVQGLPLAVGAAGGVCLEAAWGGYGWDQRNLADDVYDGVFEKLVISDIAGDQEYSLFDGGFTGWEAFVIRIMEKWEGLIDWFVRNM